MYPTFEPAFHDDVEDAMRQYAVDGRIDCITQGRVQAMSLDDAIEMLHWKAVRVYYSPGLLDYDLVMVDAAGFIWQFDVPHPGKRATS